MNDRIHRQLLDALPDTVVAIDNHGKITYVNARLKPWLGWPPEALLGQPIEKLLWSLPPFRRGCQEASIDVSPDCDTHRVASKAWNQAGVLVPVELRMTCLDPDQQPACAPETQAAPCPGGMLLTLHERQSADRWCDLSRGLRATVETAARLGAHTDPSSWSEGVTHSLVRDFDAALAAIWVHSPYQGRLVLGGIAAADGLTPEERRSFGDPNHPLWAASQVTESARRRQPLVNQGPPINETQADRPSCWFQSRGIVGFATLPLLRGGELLGVVVHLARMPLSDEFVAALTAFAAVVAASLGDRQLYERVEVARAEAEDQRGKLQTVLDVLPVGVVLLEGAEGRVTLVNPAAQAMAHTASVLTADVLSEINTTRPVFHLDGRPYQLSERPLWRALFRGERVRETLKYQCGEGNEVYVEISAAPFPGPHGGAVAGFRDVTEEIQLRSEQSERAAQFKALLDHLPVGVAYFDEHGTCRAANGATRRLLHRSREATIGAHAIEIFSYAPALQEGLARCLDERHPQSEQSAPWPDPSSPGGARYLDWRFEPLPTTSGFFLGALALIVDVTHRKHSADQLRLAAEAATQASRNKTQFLSAVSHDLRTPANALSLLADCLEHASRSEESIPFELANLVGDLKRSTSSLVELVNDLLDLTQIESGELSYHPTQFLLGEWLDDILIPLRFSARAKGLDFSWSADERDRLLNADKVKLSRVLTNLAGNAIKFTEKGAISIRAGVTPGGMFALSVTDSGQGIAHDDLDRIFDEFAQLRNRHRDRNRGNGLGLAICRRLVEGAGGQIVAESRLGFGSTFTALYPPDHVPLPSNSSGSFPTLWPDDSQPPLAEAPSRILLVEDDLFSRRSLSRLLERQGFHVLQADNGPAAIAAVQQHHPCLVLLDLMLPGMDGAVVLRELRLLADARSLPVIILSGDLLSDRSRELEELDAYKVLAKPIEFSQLLQVVKDCLAATSAPA